MHKTQCMNVKIDGGKSIKLDPTVWLAVNMSNEEELLCIFRNYIPIILKVSVKVISLSHLGSSQQ